MGAPKKNPLEVKIPVSIGIKRKYAIALDEKCQELGLKKSILVESLIEQFLKDLK